MKVGVYYSNSDLRIEQSPVPHCGPDDLLVKVMASGICGSDLMEWYRIKRAPLVLGHELAGEIVEVGKSVMGFAPGERIAATHHVPCDECLYCRGGHETACKTFQTTNNFDPGGFSQFLRITGRSLLTGVFKLPEHVTLDQGTFVEPLGTVVRGLRAADVQKGQSVAILGSGLAGLLMIKLARARGAGPIIATDMSHERCETARRFGADFAFQPNPDLSEQIVQCNAGRLVDKVILCAGALPAAQQALTLVDKGGTVLFFAVPKPGETVTVDFNPFWRNDVTLKTCYGAAPRDNREAVDILDRAVVTVEDMITHRFALDDIQEAFGIAAAGGKAMKVIIEPHGGSSQ